MGEYWYWVLGPTNEHEVIASFDSLKEAITAFEAIEEEVCITSEPQNDGNPLERMVPKDSIVFWEPEEDVYMVKFEWGWRRVFQ